MAASSWAFTVSRNCDFTSLKPSSPPQTLTPLSRALPFSRYLLLLRRARESRLLSSSPAVTGCLVSGVGGGGVSDEFVSTRRSGSAGCREFSALANVLRQIEPLDTSVIGKGASAAARESMKRTISTMLGLLPSDHFGVTIRVSEQPLQRLLVSSVITGYTLWNAEYRVSLTKNFESSSYKAGAATTSSGGIEVSREEMEGREDGCRVQGVDCSVEMIAPDSVSDLSPAALIYIKELESELITAEKELDDQKQEYIHLERYKEGNNEVLKYLRSLDLDMVSELSQPSSSEVVDIIQQLGQNIHMKIFNDEASSFLQESDIEKSNGVDHPDTVVTTRDYLAKLLYWCMLLGHHLRSLEYRLHLSCVVGLL